MYNLSDEEVGEVCGIFAGDGTLYKTNGNSVVLEIRGGLDEQDYYKNTIIYLFSTLFQTDLKVLKRKYNGGHTVGKRKCGKIVFDIFCGRFGFKVGRKSSTVSVPKFIKESRKLLFAKGYIRGVFDTDGSIYIRKTGKGYSQPVISLTSVSSIHLIEIKEMLNRLGFNSWIEKSNYRVRLGGWSTTRKFLESIKPNNERHWIRIKNFAAENAEVAKWYGANLMKRAYAC